MSLTQEQEEYLNRQLEFLYIALQHETQGWTEAMVYAVMNSLQTNQSTKLSIKGSDLDVRFTDKHIIKLTESLIAANIQLAEVSLPYHEITDVGFEELCRLLKPGLFQQDHNSSYSSNVSLPRQTLTVFNLQGNEISGDYLSNTILMSKYDCSLTSLNLSSNPISKKGQQTLAEMIANNRTLKHLSLNSCSFDIQTLISVCAYLYENQTLQTLLLDRPILTKTKENEIVDHFHRILTRETNLTSLSFKYHNINDKGACLFAEALNINHSLISLNLECNKIGVMGAEALASNLIIKQNRSLQFLGLSFNEINDNGAIALAEVIKENTSLRALTLKNNSIGPVGLAAIGKALEKATTLESLTLFGNHFDNQTGQQYYELIQHRLQYTGIKLDIDVYVVDGNYMIAEVK